MITRTLSDIAQVLESAADSDRRVERVMSLLAGLVPYDHCALLQVAAGSDPRFLVVPDPSAEVREALLDAVRDVFGTLMDAKTHAVALAARPSGVHLAVPLIGLDRVVGVLYVRSQQATYDDGHVRALSVCAAMLAAYLTTLDAQAELAELARERDAACHEAERAGRAKDEFLQLVTHELKGPLQTCRAWTELARDSADDVARRRALDELERAAIAGGKVVDGILELAFVASELRLSVRATEPVDLLGAAIASVQADADAKSVHVASSIERDAPTLYVDPDRIRQAVALLLANAIRFAPPGGRVAVSLSRHDAAARIEVGGDGRGFRRDVLPRVFDRFPSALPNRDDGALDVGLAVVKTIVEQHGGRIRADSDGPEHGATFTIELPLAPRAPVIPAAGSGVLAGVRVLLVDKDASFRESFQAVLEVHGAVVTSVADAAAVLTALEHGFPDVMLCGDLADGKDGTRDLMRAVATRVCPFPIASISASDDDEREDGSRLSDAAGFLTWLPKPMPVQALIDAIAQLAGRPPS